MAQTAGSEVGGQVLSPSAADEPLRGGQDQYSYTGM